MLGCSVAFFGWRHITKPEPWSDERIPEGSIYSLATGITSEVGEIAVAGGFLRADPTGYDRVVCCYEVKSGRILWEQRDAGYPEVDGLQIHVCIDNTGDVILASHKPFTPQSPEASVAKLDGPTGRLIWERKLNVSPVHTDQGVMPGIFERPVLDAHRNIWLAEYIASGYRNKPQIVVLDGCHGKLVFQRQLHESRCEASGDVGFFQWPLQIECLDEGGAFVLAVDYDGRPHAVRFSSEGKSACRFSIEFPGDKPADALELRGFVDEKHRRITFIKECWRGFCTMRGSNHVHATAFSLDAGKKQWEAIHELGPENCHSAGHLPELAVLRKNGDLELRHEAQVPETKTNWLRWGIYKGIPMPERTVSATRRLARTVISGADGSIRNVVVDSSLENWFEVQTTEAGTSTREIFVSGYGFSHYVAGRVRCPDPRRWMPARNTEGSTPKQNVFRLVRSPSGQSVMARDDRRYMGENFRWQLMGGL